MNVEETLTELKSLGTEQNRKVYARHGVGEPMFGVSYANLGKLRKRIKVDQSLAEQLWASGIHDARVLATMIADPEAIKASQLDAWAKDVRSYVLANAVSALTAKTPFAVKKFEKWSASRTGWIASSGWDVLAVLAGGSELPDEYFATQLVRIEANIHRAENRVRYSMNGALIGIGLRNETLQAAAIEAAGRIGKVEVDHGETSCQTPDAAAYIRKAVASKAARKKKS